MGLETGEFIADLVQTNPVTATDPVAQGSDHIRLLKKTIQQSLGLMPSLGHFVDPITIEQTLVVTQEESGQVASGSRNHIVLDSNANVGMSFLSPDANRASIMFGDVTSNSAGEYRFDHAIDEHALYIANVLKMQVTNTDLIANNRLTVVGGDARIDNAFSYRVKDFGGTYRGVVSVDASDICQLGSSNLDTEIRGLSVAIPTSLEVGTIPSQSGDVRLKSLGTIKARNAANSGDVTLLQLNAGDTCVIGGGNLVRILELAGTGTRAVFADAAGNLTAP